MPPRKKAAAAAAATTRSSRSKTKAAAEAMLEGLGAAEIAGTNDRQPTLNSGGGSAGAGSGSRAMTKKDSAPKELSPSPPAPKTTTTNKTTAAAKQSKEVQIKSKAKTASANRISKGKAKIVHPPRTTPPTESSAEPETSNSILTSPKNSIVQLSAVAENLTLGRMRKRNLDAVEMDSMNEKEVDATKHKKAKTGASVSTPKKRGTRKYTPFSVQNVEAWFAKYRDDEKEEFMSPAACNRWMEELGISEDSAAFYVLAWKLDTKTIFTITKQEFVEGMKKLGIDSNEKLLDLLPIILDQVSPNFESLEFKAFYKFCFNYGKSGGPPATKNVELPIAIEFLKVVLDKERYRVDYVPPTVSEEQGGRKMEGGFPHLYAFIEFLQTAAKLKVINRDQWESFLAFNKSVGWGLEGYSEESAWPSLFDEYAEWRRTKYPETIVITKADEPKDKDEIN